MRDGDMKNTKETQRVAIYGRVSTVAGQKVEMQLCELREYAGRRGWHVAGESTTCQAPRSRGRRSSKPSNEQPNNLPNPEAVKVPGDVTPSRNK